MKWLIVRREKIHKRAKIIEIEEVVKRKVDPQEEKERESSERKEKSEVSLHEKESEAESSLVRTNNSLRSLAIYVLQHFEDLVHETSLLGYHTIRH